MELYISCVEIGYFLTRSQIHKISHLLKQFFFTCSSWLSGVSSAITVGSCWSQPVYLLETAALLAPHMVDLHSSLTLRSEVQILLGQMSPQLPDLKLKESEKQKDLTKPEYTNLKLLTVLSLLKLREPISSIETVYMITYGQSLQLFVLWNITHCN